MEKLQINYEDPEYNYDQPTIPKLLKKKNFSPNYKKNSEYGISKRPEPNNLDNIFESTSRREKFYSILGKIKTKKYQELGLEANENKKKWEENNENIFLKEKKTENCKNEGFIKRTKKSEDTELNMNVLENAIDGKCNECLNSYMELEKMKNDKLITFQYLRALMENFETLKNIDKDHKAKIDSLIRQMLKINK